MDQFGVLVESTGFKVGKSTPIADLKGKTGSNNSFPQNSGTNAGFNTKSSSMNAPYNSNSFDASFVDGLDGIFRSSGNRNQETFNGFDDFPGVLNVNPKPVDGGLSFDLDYVFNGTSNFGGKTSPSPVYGDVYDILGDFTGSKHTSSVDNDNVFVNAASVPQTSDPVDDWLGIGSKSNGLRRNDSSSDGFRLKPPPNGKVKIRNEKSPNMQTMKEKEKPQRRSEPQKESPKVDFDSIFNMDAQPNHSRTSTKDSVFDSLFPSRDTPKVERTSSWATSETKMVSHPVTNIADDFSFYFEMGGGPSSGDFQEIEGESEERRKSRLKHHQKTQERMVRALHEKTQRDLRVQQEQEERHRLSETLDDSIKRWATGKEGNLRALLSSLQYVLWPECGWQSVSLTDLITSSSVKKVYHKATLCVHPDKVQQKGASVQQKYIAEKVFDLLKEAWTKFNKEEL